MNLLLDNLREKIRSCQSVVGVCGLGYVGLPLARAIAERFRVVGFDIDQAKVDLLNAGRSFIKHIPSETIAKIVGEGAFTATTDYGRMRDVDVIVICVPTPLNRYREPDLSFVVGTAEAIAANARPGQLIILESTSYPGTTTELLEPILERGGLKCGTDIWLACSPEREDPGNVTFETRTIPKVVGADSVDALDLAELFYSQFIQTVVRVSSAATAEATKLTENIFRAVNIALVNELKVVFSAMGIDVWEVINAAKTKPFGFMPFYPGPGLGGHCIPIDPFYLTWKAREYGISTRFIELAGEINTAMPHYVVNKLAEALDRNLQRGLSGSSILLLGLAYKKNVDDMRESPALKLIELIEERGGRVDYHDPHILTIPPSREHRKLENRRSVALDPVSIGKYDAVLLATDHDAIDYQMVVNHARILVDTRNVSAGVDAGTGVVVKA